MARKTPITYRLPRAVVVITGVMRRTHDKDLDRDKRLSDMPAKLISHAIELRHEAEPGEPRTVEVEGGWLFQYKAAFTATEDGRLTKATTETTGVGAELVAAGATLAGVAMTAAGVALSDAKDPHLEGYKADGHSAEAEEREALVTRRAEARQKIQALMEQVIQDPAKSDEEGPKLRQLRNIQSNLDERIQVLDTVYQAWLATRVTSVDEQFEIVVPLAQLPTSLQTAVTLGDPPPQAAGQPPGTVSDPPPEAVAGRLVDLWKQHGLTVFATWSAARKTDDQTPSADTKQVFARLAEPVTLSVVERVNDVSVITKRHGALVADERSTIVPYTLGRTLFGRRSLELSFSNNGYLTGVAAEGAAVLGETAKAITGVPAAIASGVDSYTSVQTGIASAHRASLDAKLAQVKAEVELRQQQALAAGLDYTANDAARLDRLKQLQGILDAQSAISKADPSLVTSLQGRSGQDLDWYSPPAPAAKEDNTLTVILQSGTSPRG